MAGVSSSGPTAYQWTDYDKKIKTSENKAPQQVALKEALKDDKLKGSEINTLKENYRQAFMKENPNESLDTADSNFYTGLASVTGIDSNKLRYADSSAVEFTFNIQNNSIASITQDNNEDGDNDVVTTKKGGAEATVTSPDVKTPTSLIFKDYKTNNFDNSSKIPENKDNFSKGDISTIKEEKVIAAIGGQAETSSKDTIKSFQSSIGLTGKDIDGKFGPKTLSFLANKYTDTLNIKPQTNESKAELVRLGTAIDKLQPIFEGTEIGNDLKTLRASIPPSSQTDATKKIISDKREVIKTAGELVNRGTQALKNNPAGLKKVFEDVGASNLPDSVKAKVVEQLIKMTGDKLTSNIGSPPAQTLTGRELVDNLPNGNPTKEAFKTMYLSKAENGKTTWTLKTPDQMAETLKSGNTEITKKVFAALGPEKSQALAEKSLKANIGKSPLTGTDFIDALPDGNATKEKFKTMYSSKVENGKTTWDLKTPVQIADDKLTTNIGSPPAKRLVGSDLINTLPDGNATKDAFKAMYSEGKGKPTTWTLKTPDQISESLKGASSEVTKKVLSSLSPKDAQAVAEKSLKENIGSPPAQTLKGSDFIDSLPDGNATKDAFKAMYSSKVENGQTTWTLKTSEPPTPVTPQDTPSTEKPTAQALIDRYSDSFHIFTSSESTEAKAKAEIQSSIGNLSDQDLIELKNQTKSVNYGRSNVGVYHALKDIINAEMQKRNLGS